jgi:hypothetical protein
MRQRKPVRRRARVVFVSGPVGYRFRARMAALGVRIVRREGLRCCA